MWACWGHGQTALGEKVERTPPGTGNGASYSGRMSLIQRRVCQAKGQIKSGSKLLFENPDLLYNLGTENLSMTAYSPQSLTSGGPENDFGTKALKVTSRPSKHRILVPDVPLEFIVRLSLGRGGN